MFKWLNVIIAGFIISNILPIANKYSDNYPGVPHMNGKADVVCGSSGACVRVSGLTTGTPQYRIGRHLVALLDPYCTKPCSLTFTQNLLNDPWII